MRTSIRFASMATAATLAAVALTACGTVDPYGPTNYPVSSAPSGTYSTYPAQQAPAGFVEYGRITNVSLLSGGPSAQSGNSTAGTLIGGVVGGVVGNQIGSGSGRAAATVLGAVGGAVVGNQIARNRDGSYNSAGPVYRISVQTDQGAMRSYDVSATGDLRPGDRVRIENGVIYRG